MDIRHISEGVAIGPGLDRLRTTSDDLFAEILGRQIEQREMEPPQLKSRRPEGIVPPRPESRELIVAIEQPRESVIQGQPDSEAPQDNVPPSSKDDKPAVENMGENELEPDSAGPALPIVTNANVTESEIEVEIKIDAEDESKAEIEAYDLVVEPVGGTAGQIETPVANPMPFGILMMAPTSIEEKFAEAFAEKFGFAPVQPSGGPALDQDAKGLAGASPGPTIPSQASEAGATDAAAGPGTSGTTIASTNADQTVATIKAQIASVAADLVQEQSATPLNSMTGIVPASMEKNAAPPSSAPAQPRPAREMQDESFEAAILAKAPMRPEARPETLSRPTESTQPQREAASPRPAPGIKSENARPDPAQIVASTQHHPPARPTATGASSAPAPASIGDGAFSGDATEFASPESATLPGWSVQLAQGSPAKRQEFLALLRGQIKSLPAHEQISIQMQRALREGTGRITVQLSPAELGRIHVRMEIDEDKRVTASIVAERPATLELLQRDVKLLERALQEAGLKLDANGTSFNLSRGGAEESNRHQARQEPAGTTSTSDGSEPDDMGQSEAGLVDTANGLLNMSV